MFEGFEPANTTPVPDVLFDQLLAELTGAELKAILYIIRRTWGFKKNDDTISLSQFQCGITTKDGRVLDRGCGIKDRTTLVKALNTLQKKGYIKSIKPVKDTGEHEVTQYAIRFVNEGSGQNLPRTRKTLLPVVGKPDEGSGQNHPTGSVENPTTRSRETRRTRNSNTTNSIQVCGGDAAIADITPPAPLQENTPASRLTSTRRKEPVDLLESAPAPVQTIVAEWRGVFKSNIPTTAKLIEQATILAAFAPAAGEIAACRLWMYQTDTKKWYSTHGMHLGDVAREFERFRSLASIPVTIPTNVTQAIPSSRYNHLPPPPVLRAVGGGR